MLVLEVNHSFQNLKRCFVKQYRVPPKGGAVTSQITAAAKQDRFMLRWFCPSHMTHYGENHHEAKKHQSLTVLQARIRSREDLSKSHIQRSHEI